MDIDDRLETLFDEEKPGTVVLTETGLNAPEVKQQDDLQTEVMQVDTLNNDTADEVVKKAPQFVMDNSFDWSGEISEHKCAVYSCVVLIVLTLLTVSLEAVYIIAKYMKLDDEIA